MRPLLEHEVPLVRHLFNLAGLPVPQDLRAEPMADGGMGSLTLDTPANEREFGSAPAECEFYDRDGILVSAALYCNKQGTPIEVDVWKVDFSPLEQWPSREDLERTAKQ